MGAAAEAMVLLPLMAGRLAAGLHPGLRLGTEGLERRKVEDVAALQKRDRIGVTRGRDEAEVKESDARLARDRAWRYEKVADMLTCVVGPIGGSGKFKRGSTNSPTNLFARYSAAAAAV